jgi:2-amino-4-hydroxy-6-hydroxymethyldihydropteridine diphosphokinase
VVYTISIGSNEQQKENLSLARKRLKDIEREAGRMPEEKKQEIVRLDLDLLSCDDTVYKPDDLKRDYICRGLKEIE